MNLKPRKFNWILDNQEWYGFIAQELHLIFPHLKEKFEETYCCDNPNYDDECPCDVSGNEWHYSLDYGQLTPYIISAFQQYKTQTDLSLSILEARIESLENI